MDLYSRKIIAWVLAPSLEARYVVEAINKAKACRKTDEPLILHSDRGQQYVSQAYREAAEKFQLSYSNTGYPYDNACIESFLYVYQIHEDGCHVVFDLDTDDFPATKPGEVVPFDTAFEKYVPDLLAGREIPPVISKDFYGHLLTIYTPLYDAQGACRCYVAVDYSMKLLMDYVLDIVRQIIFLFLFVVLAIIVVSVFLTDRGIIRPMKCLERRAYRDTLTGLLNRTAYYEYNQVLDGQIASGEADFSILMVDVNFLKRMNDTHGHEKGNEYLKNAAALISRVFGQERLYRTGGDEFVGVFDGNAQDAVQQSIREFKGEIADLQSRPGLQPWQRVSAAVGLAAYDSARDKCAEDVLKRADAAMYQDKLAMKAERRD